MWKIRLWLCRELQAWGPQASCWSSGSTRICLSSHQRAGTLLSHGRMAAQCCPSKLSCQQTRNWRFCNEELQICLGPLNQSKDKLYLGERLHTLCRRAAKLIQSFLISYLLGLRLLGAQCLPSFASMKNYNGRALLVQLHAVHLLVMGEFNSAGNAEVGCKGWTVPCQNLSSFVPAQRLCLKSLTICPLPYLIVINMWKQTTA